jgi:outer membrane protein, heavy metal efflux system
MKLGQMSLALASLSVLGSSRVLALSIDTLFSDTRQAQELSTNLTTKRDVCLLAGGPMARPEATPMPNIRTAAPATGQSQTPSAVPLNGQIPASTSASDSNKNTEHLDYDGASTKGQKVSGTVEYEEEVPDQSQYPPVKVVDALNDALINSPRAAAIRAQFGITQAGYATVTEVPNPIFFFDRGIVAEQENRIGPILTEEPPWKLFFRFLVQKRVVDQTMFDLMTQLWQLRADTRRAYTEVVVAQETFRTLNELYELSAKLESVASKRFQAGDVPELDALKARLATSQANADRVVAAQRVIRARQQLNVIMGRSVESPIHVPALPDYTGGNAPKFALNRGESDVLPDFSKDVEPLPIFLSTAESNRLELKSLFQQIKVNKANLQAAYGNVIPNPTLALGKSYGGNLPAGPKITAVFFTFNVQTPMTNTNQGAVVQYKATLKQLRFQIAAQRNQNSSDVSSAYQNLLAARDKLRTYQEHVLADSFEVARLARRSYEVGQSNITATLQAQQANVQTRTAYLDAVSAYQSSFTDLEQACGIPLQ